MVLWEKQEGATKEDIEQLSKFKFQRKGNEKLAGNTQGPVGGIMTECRADSPIEHVLADEDAVCCKFCYVHSKYSLVSLDSGPFALSLNINSTYYKGNSTYTGFILTYNTIMF